ncbi:hypothetical protein CHL67_02480 [Prosthecochloris sp. GSB1]|uniref:GumC family protein n=1 Tax=Prosthecochloris sp. GSB1 TaxID=281093 RepID=UPI000B8C88BE|nr:polysaccharide biosynthesis tyrosine autokinase [Prosthecochloris sp. GSB1]ASQ89937.1 hypothetical protein CHL67_02480 [Prosthecochloris sp. GSB1]
MLEMKDAGSQLNVQELLRLAWKNRYVIGLITGLALVIALFIYLSARPVYSATATIMLKSSQKEELVGELSGSERVGEMQVQNHLQLLASVPLAEEVIRSLVAGGAQDSLELFGNRPYKTKIQGFLDGMFGVSEPSRQPVQAGEILDNIRPYAELLRSRLSVLNERGTDIITVTVSSPFPREAALLANIVGRTYQKQDVAWNVEQARNVNQFVVDQLREQQKKVAEVEAAVSRYMKQENIYEVTGGAEELQERLADADARYNEVQAEARILRQRLAFLRRKLSEDEKAYSERVAETMAPRLKAVQDMIRKEESVLSELIVQRGPEDTAVRTKQEQIRNMKAQLDQITRTRIAGEIAYSGRSQRYQFGLIAEQLQTDARLAELEFSASELNRLRNYYQAQLRSLPQKQLELARLQRDRDVVNRTYSFLRERLDESGIEIASEVGQVVVIGDAHPPDSPVSPNLGMNLFLGLFSGLGLSALLLISQNLLDDTIRDDSFLEDNGFVELARIPFTGSGETHEAAVPFGIAKLFSRFTNRKNADVELHAGKSGAAPLLISDYPSTAFAESFRDLRTNIMFSRADNPVNSMLVTGTSISEGKSTVCSNLALSYSMIGKKVLVIDCDLRRPVQHQYLQTSRQPGVTDYLAGASDEIAEEFIQDAGYENLFLLAAGSPVPNPNELLFSNKMTQLIERLKARFDIVLLDSPPVLLLSDAAVLSRSVDGVVVVAKTGYTSKDQFRELGKVDYLRERMLGVALIGSVGQKKYGKYGYDYKALDYYGAGAKI